MKYIEEYRNRELINIISKKILNISKKPAQIMEICGGQTHTILKYNLEEFLPKNISLIHGPGCPVCVTPVNIIDKAISLSLRPGIILATFGDMLRVPGTYQTLASSKSIGGNIRIVYSPLDAVKIAEENPDKKIVFFAIGFETTAPLNAMSVVTAKKMNLNNYFILCSNMLVPPAIEALLSNNKIKIQGILAAGHVCTIMGLKEYELIADKYHIPIVATGFEPLDILTGIYMAILQIEKGLSKVENQYSRAINFEGNKTANDIINEVFICEDREWRGIGIISNSGLKLKEKYSEYNAFKNFDFDEIEIKEFNTCIAGEVLQGIKKPTECKSFGTNCFPEQPIGAPMVSSEGACAIYYSYRHTPNPLSRSEF